MEKIFKHFLKFINNFFFYIFILPILTPVVLLIRSLKPLLHIRFRYLSTQEIGHFVDDCAIILAEKKLTESKIIDLFWSQRMPANKFFLKMVKRQLFIKRWVKQLYEVNKIIYGGSKFTKENPRTIHGSRDINLTLYKSSKNKEAYFKFTNKETEQGKKFLEKIGLNKTDKFVCLIVRDGKYKEAKWPNHDWSYHNYRNSEIHTYKKGIEELVNKGYWVFRMGNIANKRFNCNHERIIDYSFHSDKSDFLDVWLMANCSFCISTSAGIDTISVAFRRPILILNLIPVADIMSYTEVITYPKRLRYKNDKNYFTLDQCLRNNFYNTKHYEEHDIEIIDLSEDEIKEAIIEMHERFSGNYRESKKEEDLQKKFWKKFLKWDKENVWPTEFKTRGHKLLHPNSKLSSEFLINNQKWLD